MKYDVLAYIGRFQPYHIGHRKVVEQALELAERVVIVIGSHDSPRTPKNPWTTQERIDMITRCHVDEVASGRLQFVPVHDWPYQHDRWLAEVETAIHSSAYRKWKAGPYEIGIIGFDKDASSFYLHHFPQFKIERVKPDAIINATDIRQAYFMLERINESVLDKPVQEWLDDFFVFCSPTEKIYEDLQAEYNMIEEYKAAWSQAPYPPTFVTTDAVVVNAGHILMIRRKDAPGKGLLAMPGGFIGQNELLIDSCLRELKEETQIKVPMPVLRGSIQASRTFDDPGRSLRGRTVTTAFLIKLNEKELPKVAGGDDAADAMWIPIAALKRSEVFEDHYAIIHAMVGL